jgi:hypothetical protein
MRNFKNVKYQHAERNNFQDHPDDYVLSLKQEFFTVAMKPPVQGVPKCFVFSSLSRLLHLGFKIYDHLQVLPPWPA